MYRVALILCIPATAWAQFPPEPLPLDTFPESIPCPCIWPRLDVPPRSHQARRIASPKDIVLRFNDAILNAIKEERTPPPIAARNLAIVHVAMYDAVNAVERRYQPFFARAGSQPGASAVAAAAIAAHRSSIA